MRLKRLLRPLLETRCRLCGCVLQTDEGPEDGIGGLCGACRTALGEIVMGYCPDCGDIYADEMAGVHRCSACRLNPRPWRRFHFFGAFDGLLAQIIKDFKFNGRLELGSLLQDISAGAHPLHSGDGFDAEPADIIVPVPLHRDRLLQRGFNQCMAPAAAVADRIGRPVSRDALLRVRNTTPQTRLKGKERLDNVRGAFVADSRQVEGRVVLLVDDVMTTGGTLEECSRTLLRAGARQVDVLTIARTPAQESKRRKK